MPNAISSPAEPESAILDSVFSAFADPVRRSILERLDGEDLLVSQLAEPFSISLQAVSRHIQVLVKAGFVTQERTGRISRCRLDVGPIDQVAVWINSYSKYWQSQFETQAAWNQIELGKAAPARRTTPRMQPKRRPLRRE